MTGPDLRLQLERAFLEAMGHIQEGRDDQARELLSSILETEPRFPEPYLELALLSHRRGDLERALDEARLGLEMLEEYGQWVDDVTPEQLLGHARLLVGQLLLAMAESLDPMEELQRIERLWREASEMFRQAIMADPDNEQALVFSTFCDQQEPVPDGNASEVLDDEEEGSPS
ncbi:MAG: hypothetical protein JW797_09760 [Bradymonadales bacterium]|nr:hypothetical protein [Bradymonadales bacterium]